MQALHRVRQRFIVERAAVVNQMRALLLDKLPPLVSEIRVQPQKKTGIPLGSICPGNGFRAWPRPEPGKHYRTK
jgi:hypothetical protein